MPTSFEQFTSQDSTSVKPVSDNGFNDFIGVDKQTIPTSFEQFTGAPKTTSVDDTFKHGLPAEDTISGIKHEDQSPEEATVPSDFAKSIEGQLKQSWHDFATGGALYAVENKVPVEKTPLAFIGQAATPLLAAGQVVASPFMAGGETAGKEINRESMEPEEKEAMGPELFQREQNIAGAAGQAATMIGMAAAPLFHGAPSEAGIIKSTGPVFDSDIASKQHFDALADIHMSASNPFKLTDEQINTQKAELTNRPIDEIQADINRVAADTAAPGAKEQLSQLQQEKAEALNPQVSIDRRVAEAGGKLTDEQFQNNIQSPVSYALDQGVPVQKIQQTLSDALKNKIQDDSYRQELIDRAIPASAKNIAESAPTVAKITGVPEQTVQQLTLPSDSGVTDVTSPNVVKEAIEGTPKGLNAEQTQSALGSNSVSQWVGRQWTKGVNQFDILDNLNRSWAKLNGIDIGRPDLMERSDTAPMKNIAERENGVGLSYLGSQDGTSQGVLELVQGQSQPKLNVDVTPHQTIITNAVKMGLDKDTLTRIQAATNAADGYANVDRVAQENIKDISVKQQKIIALQEELNKPENASYEDRIPLKNQIDNLTSEIKAQQKLIKTLGERQSYITREEVAATLAQYKENPAASYYLNEMSKLMDSSLKNQVASGRITQEAYQRMRDSNPNYTPAWRDADDFTFDLPKNKYTGNISAAFKRRNMSDKGADQIDFEGNQIHYLINSAKKAQAAQIRGMMLQNLTKILGDDGWNLVFRESKADVMKAINSLSNSPLDKLYAEDITKPSDTRFELYDTVNFPVNGKQIQLSVKDPNLFTAISDAYKVPDNVMGVLKPLSFISRMKVNFLTKWNPAFNIRNVERALIDDNFNTLDGKMFRNYIPGGSQLKVLAEMAYKPELYAKFRTEYGLTDPLVREYQGLNTDQIIQRIKEGKQPNVILGSIDNALTGFADRGDAATRMLEYNLTYKKGIADGLSESAARDAALIGAKNIHLNFSQRGASGNFNAVTQVFPFGRAFLNAMDKQTRYLTYAPKAAAVGAANIYVLYKGIQTWNNNYVDAKGVPIDNQVDERLSQNYWWVRYGTGVNDIFRISNGWFGGHLGRPIDMTLALAARTTGQFMDAALEKQGDSLVKQAQKLFPEVDMKHLTGKEVAQAWSNAVTKVVTPDSAMPAGIGSVYGAMTNQDNEGHPIVPQSKDGTPASMQYFMGSTDYAISGLSRELATKYGVEVSPGMAQYFSRELAGAFGESSLVAGAHLYGMMSGKNYPLPQRGDVPGFSLLSGNTSDVPHTGVEAQYYNMQQKLAPVETRAAAYEKLSKEFPEYAPVAQKYIQDHANELHWSEQFKENTSYLANIKQQIGKIAGADRDNLLGYQDINPSILGDKTKRTSINDLQIQAQSRMQGVMDSIQRDMDNGNSYASELWSARHTNSPLTDFMSKVWPNGAPKNTPDISLDKSNETGYNSPFGPPKGNTMTPMDMHQPPSISREAPDLSGNNEPYKPGSFEQFLPNLRHETVNMYRDDIISNTIDKFEGSKFTNTPDDRGGATKYGITLATMQAINPKATANDVKNLTEQQAKDIYIKNYWDKGQIEKMPIQVQDLAFDMNVNHGLGGSTLIIQRALRDLGATISVDGKLGNGTLNAMNDYADKGLRKTILMERTKFYEDIVKNDPSQKKFLDNWKSRTEAMENQIPDTDEGA